MVAQDLAALTSAESVHLVNSFSSTFAVIWTGTAANGSRLGAFGGSGPEEFCDDWTSSAYAAPGTGRPRAWVGNADQTSKVWTENGLGECAYWIPIYCLGHEEVPGVSHEIPPLQITAIS